jgi:hypothetical protein
VGVYIDSIDCTDGVTCSEDGDEAPICFKAEENVRRVKDTTSSRRT